MSQLIVINDPLRGERERVDLYCGESLASNLRRHWPRGIDGPWRVYRDAVHADNEVAALDLPLEVVRPFSTYILARGAAADPLGFVINLAISLALSYIATLLQPRRIPPHQRTQETQESGNNQLAGQSNQVRLGGRVPELLGTVRSYPDLLCAPIEQYHQRTQNLKQYFVVGMGDHEIPPELVKLGETPINQIGNATAHIFHPGEVLPALEALRESPEVNGISLNPEGDAPAPVIGAVFNAAAKTLTVPTYQPWEADKPITIASTSFNDGFRWVMDAPLPTDTAPFVYYLDGPVVDETGSNPTIYQWEQVLAQYEQQIWFDGNTTFISGTPTPTPTAQDIRINLTDFPVGSVILLTDEDGTIVVRGTVTQSLLNNVTIGGAPWPTYLLRVTDVNGVVVTVPNAYTEMGYIAKWAFPTALRAGPVAPHVAPPLEPTSWYTAPMEDPDEIWIDVGFPQGLIVYSPTGTDKLTIVVKAEFKRADADDPQAEITFPGYMNFSTSPLRFTERVSRAALIAAGLPAPTTGSAWVQVRLTRVTPFFSNSAELTYTQDTRWARLQAMRLLDPVAYPDVTIAYLSMANTRNAVSMGNTSFNCIATRKLPTWTGSAWTAPAATNRWADNFVARCKAVDGANKSDAQIDLAGIYALQAALDAAPDPGGYSGAQGAISMTIDQVQDIDTELISIADVVRAVVYRVGKKIFVTRDQATALRIALFNGRAKNPDAESVAVRMTNDGENDSVTVSWLDAAAGYKVREYTHPPVPASLQFNPARVSAFCANWPQAWRRAAYEWNRIRYRREQIAVRVTEDGRICRPGDVVNITDDVANLAASAGEVLYVSGAVLTLDRDVLFEAGHTYSILLRDVLGQVTDSVPVIAVAGSPHKVQLSRTPTVTIKPRDTSTGTLYAFFDDAAAIVRPWLLTGVSVSGPYVELTGANYSADVYTDDTATVPARPVLPGTPPVLLSETSGHE